jgi:hypothetical protein
MKAVATVFIFCAVGLHAEPGGATDLVPHFESAAKEKLKIPESQPTTVVITANPSFLDYRPPATIPLEKPIERK